MNAGKRKILIVEDERNIADILAFNLEMEGFETVSAATGPDGVRLADQENPDLILLDIMLPGFDGFEACRRIREKSQVPIIMLTARESEADMVLGLDSGADDYVTKPFKLRVLMARVNSNLRRASSPPSEPMEAVGGERGIVLDEDRVEIRRDGMALDLTMKEYELFKYLIKNPGVVFTREELMKNVWGYAAISDDVRMINTTVCRLRDKVEADPRNPVYVMTRRNAGYYYSPEPK